MSTKKIKTVQEVKELLNSFVTPTYIGSTEHNRLELSPQQTVYKAQNIINVCKMALFGIADMWGSVEVNDLQNTASIDLYDIANTLEIATQLLPHVEMEFIEKLQEEL